MSVRTVIKEDIEKHHNDIRNAVKCSICLDLYTEPVKLNVCDHTFCLKCYMTLFTTSTSPKSVPCPLCKQQTQRRAYVVNEEAKSVVESLREIEQNVLPKLDETINTIQRNINEHKFIQTMQSTNRVQRWIDKCRNHKDTNTLLVTSSEESGSEDETISLNQPDNLKILDQLDLLYYAKPKKKVFRKTKSLTNIITKIKRNRKKCHSTGNVQIVDDEVVVIEEYDSAGTNACNKDNRILHLLEEDVLNNFEMEMFGYVEESANVSGKNNTNTTPKNKKNNSAKKQNKKSNKTDDTSIDKSETSLNSSTPWSRMNAMKKEIKKTEVKKKGRKYKQLGVNTDVTKYGSKNKEKEFTNEQSENELDNPEQLITKPKVVNLEDFEKYLSKNLTENDGTQVETVAEPTVEIKVERNTSYDGQNTVKVIENAGCNDENDIFTACTQKLNVKEIDETEEQTKDTQRNRASKQQMLGNDLDDIRVSSPDTMKHDLYRSIYTELENIHASADNNDTEAENAIVNVEVLRSSHGTLFKNKPCLVEVEDVPKQNQTDQNSVTESNRSKNKRNRKSTQGTVLETDAKKSNRKRKLTNQTNDDIISTSSNDDFTNNSKTNSTNQNKNVVDARNQNKDVTDSERDIFSGTELSNVCLDNIPVRRSSRIRKPSIKQAEEKKDSAKSTGRRSGIVQKAIDKWKSTSPEPNTEAQEELKAGLKSVLDQQAAMVASLQNSLNGSNKMLSNLSNYLTNSDSLFSHSSSSQGKTKHKESSLDIKNLCDKSNVKLPDYYQSLPTLSAGESKETVSFFYTAIPRLHNIHKFYSEISLLTNRIDTETENFTNIFSKSLLKNCDSLKQSSDSANSNLELVISAKVSPETGNKITNLEFTTNKISNTNVAVQTEMLNCPKCSYSFDINSNDVPNVEIVPVPVEFSHVNDTSITHSDSSQSVPILRDIPSVSIIANITETCKLASQTVSQNQSSSGSEIKCGRKVNRQLFSSEDSEKNQKRKFKRIRTLTPDSDTEPVRAKKAKPDLQPGKMLYREHLDVVFDSETREKNTENQQEVEGVDYPEYMKQWLERQENDMEANVTEIDGNEAREMRGKAARNSGKITSEQMKSVTGKNTKQNTQDIAAAYEKILEQEFKTVQFTKPQLVRKPIQPPDITDQFETLPNTVLDNLLTSISFETAANSTAVEKTVDRSQLASASNHRTLTNISFENAANSTLVDKSQMTASLFAAASESVQNKSEREQRNRVNMSYTDDIISASLLTQVNKQLTKKSVVANERLTGADLNVMLVVADDDLDNEVADITCNRQQSMESDKDIFDDDNIVESTPHKELLAQGDRSKLELNTSLPNPILELIDPPNTVTGNLYSEWLDNIAPPSEFQDTEQMPLRPTSPDKYPAIDLTSLSSDKFTGTAGASKASTNHSALNQGFRGSQLDTTSENIIEPTNHTRHNNVDVDNVPVHSLSIVFSNKDSIKKAAPTTEPSSTGWLSSSKNLNPLVLAQKEKFSPLQIIIERSPPSKSVPCSTPKQKSILSYMSPAPRNENTLGPATPLKTTVNPDPKCTPSVRDSLRENLPTTSGHSEKAGGKFETLNIKKYTPAAKSTSTGEDVNQITTGGQNVARSTETLKHGVCIASTRLKKDELIAILTLTTKFNARYSKEFTRQVTHLVVTVDEMNRAKDHTIKYILAISHGIWIVSVAWIQDCLFYKRLVSEEAYEVLDVSGNAGPRLSRLSRATYPLLKGFVIHCAEPYMSVSRMDLENAISSLGGHIVPCLADLERETSKLRLILSEAKVTQDFDHYEMWRQKYKTLVVDIEWLSRSVGQYRVVSVRPFILCLEEGIDAMGYPYALIAVTAETPTQLTH